MVLVVAVSGPSRSGKSRLSRFLAESLTGAVTVISQDDFWFQPCEVIVNGKPQMSEEDPQCTGWDKLVGAVEAAREDLQRSGGGGFLVVEGFTVLSDQRLVDACDVIFHLDLSKEEVIARRSAPATPTCPNPHPKSLAYCEEILWPTHEAYEETVQVLGSGVRRLDVSSTAGTPGAAFAFEALAAGVLAAVQGAAGARARAGEWEAGGGGEGGGRRPSCGQPRSLLRTCGACAAAQAQKQRRAGRVAGGRGERARALCW
jgi:uridine kinase